MSFVDPDDVQEATEYLSQAIAEAKAVLHDQVPVAGTSRAVSPRAQLPNELEELRAALESTRKASQKKLNGMASQNKRLQAERDKATGDVAHLRQELDRREKAHQSSKEYEATIRQLEGNQELLSATVEELRTKNKSLEENLKKLEQANMSLQHDERLSQYKRQISEMTADAIRKEQMLSNKDTLVQQLKQNIAKQTNQICTLEGDVESKNSTTLMLQTELEIAKQNAESKTTQLKELREQHNKLQSELMQLQNSSHEKDQQYQRSAENTRHIIAGLKADTETFKQRNDTSTRQLSTLKEDHEKVTGALQKITKDHQGAKGKLLHIAASHFKGVGRSVLFSLRGSTFNRWREFTRQRRLDKKEQAIEQLKTHHQTNVSQFEQFSKQHESEASRLRHELDRTIKDFQHREKILLEESAALQKKLQAAEGEKKDLGQSKESLDSRLAQAEQNVTEERNNALRQIRQLSDKHQLEIQNLENDLIERRRTEEKLRTDLNTIRQEQLQSQKQHFDDQRTIATLQRSNSANEEKAGCSEEELSVWKQRVSDLESQLTLAQKEKTVSEAQRRELAHVKDELEQRTHHGDGRSRNKPLQLEVSIQTDPIQFQTDASPSGKEKQQLADEMAQLEKVKQHLQDMQRDPTSNSGNVDQQDTIDALLLRRQDEASTMQKLIAGLQATHVKEVGYWKDQYNGVLVENKRLNVQTSSNNCSAEKLSVFKGEVASSLMKKVQRFSLISMFQGWKRHVFANRQVQRVKVAASQSIKQLEGQSSTLKRIADEALQQNKLLKQQLSRGDAARATEKSSQSFAPVETSVVVNGSGQKGPVQEMGTQVNDYRIQHLEEQNKDYANQLKKMGDLLKVARNHLAQLVQQLKDSKSNEQRLNASVAQLQQDLQIKSDEMGKLRRELRRVLTSQEPTPSGSENTEYLNFLQSTRSLFIHDLAELCRFCDQFNSAKVGGPASNGAAFEQGIFAIREKLYSITSKYFTDAEKHHVGISPNTSKRW